MARTGLSEIAGVCQSLMLQAICRMVVLAALGAATVGVTSVAAQSDTLTAVSPAVAVPAAKHSYLSNVPIMALGAVSAATFNQGLGSPKGWSQTWGGYGRRLGDQVGFAIVEEGVRLSLDATVAWVPDTLPCRGRIAAGRAVRLGALVPRLGCAVRETVLLRNQLGEARPNFPLGVGVFAASAASTIWRPDASTSSKALTLAATRVAVVFGATVLSHLVTDWRNDRRR